MTDDNIEMSNGGWRPIEYNIGRIPSFDILDLNTVGTRNGGIPGLLPGVAAGPCMDKNRLQAEKPCCKNVQDVGWEPA
jgi:hypothetical protein